MRWAEPTWLILLVLLPLPFWLSRRDAAIGWPSIPLLFGKHGRKGAWRDRIQVLSQTCVLGCVVLALARPQTVGGLSKVRSEGVAILLALDRSSSMNAADFRKEGTADSSRLESARRTLIRFVEGRPDDLIGLVAFANLPDLTCPLTLDHRFVIDSVRALRTARADDDGTNLGDAIVWGLEALEKAPAIRKRLVLLSDGRNAPQRSRSHRPTDPLEAAELARKLGIVIDTIAIGDEGGLIREKAPGVDLDLINEVGGPDLALLGRIAEIGGGLSFRAKDEAALASAFEAIDGMEKSRFEATLMTRYEDRYAPFALASCGLLMVSVVLRSSRGGRLP